MLYVDALELRAGERMALLGPNGSGKSTLLLAAALLTPLAGGELRLFGEHARSRRDRVRLRRATAMVFQDSALLDMSARRNLQTALALNGVPGPERASRADAWLQRLGVAHCALVRPHRLSGGEAQRVSVARALVVQPRLLLLDEPFASLDAESRARLVGELAPLLEREGAAVLLATHDHAEARLIAQRAAVLLDGRIAQVGPVEEVFRHPVNADVARVLGYGLARAEHLAPLLGDAALLGPLAALPPGALRLAGAGERGGGVFTVLAVEPALGAARVIIDAGAPLPVQLAVHEVHALGIRPGLQVSVRLDPAAIVWLDAAGNASPRR